MFLLFSRRLDGVEMLCMLRSGWAWCCRRQLVMMLMSRFYCRGDRHRRFGMYVSILSYLSCSD
jgi:hypothetical protein